MTLNKQPTISEILQNFWQGCGLSSSTDPSVTHDSVKAHTAKEAKAQIETLIQSEVDKAFKRGQRVGQYQAADKLYGHVTTMWLFKDNKEPKLQMPQKADELLKDCEKYMNHNRNVYTEFLTHLKEDK